MAIERAGEKRFPETNNEKNKYFRDIISNIFRDFTAGTAFYSNARLSPAVDGLEQDQELVGAQVFRAVPRLVRPLISALVYVPARVLFWYMETMVESHARTELQEYEEACDDEEKRSVMLKTYEKKFPVAAWLMNRYQPNKRNIAQIKHDCVLGMFHATLTTSATLYSIMSELVTRPALIDELWEELVQVTIEGRLPQDSLEGLRKLDSFMRESSRMNLFQYLKSCSPNLL
ncbi:hypothetical protein F5B18DRAFT_651291 [Nemania serpens]|nr:hypothetical protein F5B18DRAFT_651291 [Nemania serpens]